MGFTAGVSLRRMYEWWNRPLLIGSGRCLVGIEPSDRPTHEMPPKVPSKRSVVSSNRAEVDVPPTSNPHTMSQTVQQHPKRSNGGAVSHHLTPQAFRLPDLCEAAMRVRSRRAPSIPRCWVRVRFADQKRRTPRLRQNFALPFQRTVDTCLAGPARFQPPSSCLQAHACRALILVADDRAKIDRGTLVDGKQDVERRSPITIDVHVLPPAAPHA